MIAITRLLPGILVALLNACSGGEVPPASQDAAAAAVATRLTPTEQARFDASCAACHGVPGTGAPAPGDTAAWSSRNAQGLDTLLDHTINGYGQMPPMGLCMDCSQEEFIAFISYMSGLECDEVEP